MVSPTTASTIVNNQRPAEVDFSSLEKGDEKGEFEHIDRVESIDDERPGAAEAYQAEEDDKPPTGLRRLLKRNPSVEFIREVAEMNETELDPEEVKAVEKKIGKLIIPALCVCYAFYYIDKTTLSYAAIFGIKKDLHLSGSEYSWLSSLFYFGWLGWALGTNYLMSQFPVAKFLAANIALWGIFLMAQGASKNFLDMAVLRVISGAFEAAADPAFVLITGTWYTRKQQPTVIGYWYCANGGGIALGGLLGYAIGNIPSTHLASWRYEFLIIGALCFLWSIVMLIFIPDSPYNTRWLTRREALVCVSRKRGDGSGVDKRRFKWDQIREGALDPVVWLLFLLGFSANVPNGGTSNFGTLVVKGFGFSTLGTTLLQIPYGAFIMIMILLAIYINHRTHHLNIRTLLMAGVTVFTVIGFALMRWTTATASRLIGYYLTGSSNAVFVLALSLVSGNVGGTSKKALASAAIFLGVAAGNIVGPFLFIDSEAPGYSTGIIGCMCSRGLEIIVILLLRFIFTTRNRKRDAMFADGDESADPSIRVYDDIGDKSNMRFRYIA